MRDFIRFLRETILFSQFVFQVGDRYIIKSGSDFQYANIVTLNLTADNKLSPLTEDDIEKITLDSSIPENADMKQIVDGYLGECVCLATTKCQQHRGELYYKQ